MFSSKNFDHTIDGPIPKTIFETLKYLKIANIGYLVLYLPRNMYTYIVTFDNERV